MLAAIKQQSKSLVILDGFPLTEEQLECFEVKVRATVIGQRGTISSLLQISRSYAILCMDASSETLARRLEKRANSHQRDDDRASQRQKRINDYQARRDKIHSIFQERGHAIRGINCEGNVGEVQKEFLRAIQELKYD
jgi:adenylate kinase family enzyme